MGNQRIQCLCPRAVARLFSVGVCVFWSKLNSFLLNANDAQVSCIFEKNLQITTNTS